MTKQANTFLCRGCVLANAVWFGLSFIISYRRAKVAPTLHPRLLSSIRFFIYLHSLSIQVSAGTWNMLKGLWSTSLCLKRRFHSLQTRALCKVSINIWTRTLHQHCLDLMCRGLEMPPVKQNSDIFNAALVSGHFFSLNLRQEKKWTKYKCNKVKTTQWSEWWNPKAHFHSTSQTGTWRQTNCYQQDLWWTFNSTSDP